jgi:hypothetical protein
LLLAIIPLVPKQTPFSSMVTQLPLKKDVFWGHWAQLFDDGPVQVAHDDEHGEHDEPLLNAWLGHVIPSDVRDGD